MATNITNQTPSVSLALPVASGLVAGNVVNLGTAGLAGILETARATTSTIAAGTAAQGLADGEATVKLFGVDTVADLTVDATTSQFAKIFHDGAGTYSPTSSTGEHIGYALEACTGSDTIKVALLPRSKQKHTVSYTFGATAVDANFFIAPRALRVISAAFVPTVAGTDASAVTADIKKCTGTTAPASGTSVLSATFNLKGTANTVQTATLTSTAADLLLAAGNRLAIDNTGTLTSVVGTVTVELEEV